MRIKKPFFLAVLLVIIIGFVVVYSMDMLLITNPKKFNIAVVLKTNNFRSDYWQMVSSGVKAAAKDFDVQIDIFGPSSETDAAGQNRIVEDVLMRKPDAIILAAIDNESLASAEKIKKSGAMLILIDSPIDTITETSFIGTDNTEVGRKAGIILANGKDGSSFRVLTLSGSKESMAEKERENGFKEAVGKLPGVDYLGNFKFDGAEDAAYELVRNLLSSNLTIQGIAGLNEAATLGAARAVKESKRDEKIKIVGFNNSIFQIKLLEEGIVKAAIVQKPFNIGYLSVETAMKALSGMKVDTKINIEANVITKENMYTQENQELLFPLVEK